ncbi:5381_t:CDS:2 [Dentiscutata heterogama]|uniref:5381_t:CDS:1 n=1 Tax=Dentiscutata heterogama TaxID=1316150 RepID=A0ACA9JYZ0_9GLOM|nr:5381_t:CDS:2 [Dentiscutata heterogama]
MDSRGLIEKVFNEENEVIKHDYSLFGNFKEISRSQSGTVRKATLGDKIIVLKSINIDKPEVTDQTNTDEKFIKAFKLRRSTMSSIFKNLIVDKPIQRQTYEHETINETSKSNEEFSTVITTEHVKEILSWIDPHNAQLEFKLILRASRDGYKKDTFYSKCKDIAHTVVVLKVKKSGEILGGYNPFTWEEIKGKKYKETHRSFIFSLKNGQFNSTLSRVKDKERAICCKEGFGPSFGYLDLYMSRSDEKIWGCCEIAYERSIKINENESQKYSEFRIEDYEVFHISGLNHD